MNVCSSISVSVSVNSCLSVFSCHNHADDDDDDLFESKDLPFLCKLCVAVAAIVLVVLVVIVVVVVVNQHPHLKWTRQMLVFKHQ